MRPIYKKSISCLLAILLSLSLLPQFSIEPNAAPGDIDSSNPMATSTVLLYQMYVDGYMNYLVYKPDFPTDDSKAKALLEYKYLFDDSDPNNDYDLMSVSQYKASSYYDESFYNSLYEDENGKLIVFTKGPLEGLVVRQSGGYLFISGFPQKAVAAGFTAPEIVFGVDPTGSGSYTYYKTAIGSRINTGNAIEDWGKSANKYEFTPWNPATDVCYVVSHGYATVKDTDINHLYALGLGSPAYQTSGALYEDMGTRYRGNGGTIVVPFMATQASLSSSSKYYYYLYIIGDNGNCNLSGTTVYQDDLSYPHYEIPFTRNAADGFSFQTACSLLADGGYLNLTLFIGDSYNLTDALCGSFPHLRSGCINTSPSSWSNITFSPGWQDVISVSGNNITGLKNGSVTTTTSLQFSINNGCAYWGNQGNLIFHTNLRVTVVGGLSFDINDDGTGGTTDAEMDAKYIVQKLVYDPVNDVWEWVSQPLTDDLTANPNAVLVTKKDPAVGTLSIDNSDPDGDFYTVDTQMEVDISNLDLGSAYRIVYVPKINSIYYNNDAETKAFFTPPDSIDASISLNSAADVGKRGEITVVQEYGELTFPDPDYYQTYQLQVKNGSTWTTVSGREEWYSLYYPNPPAGVVLNQTDGTIIFTDLDEMKTYRVVSRLNTTTFNTSDIFAPSQSILESASKNGDEFGFGVYTVTISSNKDASPWNDGSQPAITLVPDGGGQQISDLNSVPAGTYKIYADGKDTGKTIVVNGPGRSAELNYYTLTLTPDTGTNNPTGGGVYLEGETVPIDVQLDPGFLWACWVPDETAFGDVAVQNALITMPSYPLTLMATATEGDYTVEATANPGGTISNPGITKVPHGSTLTYTFTPDEGYFIFDILINGKSIGANDSYTFTNITSDNTIEVQFAEIVELNKEEHIAYIFGYPDGTVRPLSYITREEVATIFYRMLTDDSRLKFESNSNTFDDVSYSRWSNTAISTLLRAGVITGRAVDTFSPAEYITRAELTTIASRFDAIIGGGSVVFSDLLDHWSERYVNSAAARLWVNGYPDGTFRPDIYITRCESMQLINNVLCRIPETEDDLVNDMIRWPDNLDPTKWYYIAIQEATNSHYYIFKDDGIHETWTGLAN